MSDRRLRLAVVAAFLGMLTFQAWAKPRPSSEEVRRYANGFTRATAWRERLAPDFELRLLDGSTFRLSDAIGQKVVVLNFFTTWCGPCRGEMPELQRYFAEHAGDGVLLLGIDVEEKHSLVEQFVSDLKLAFPVGIDAAGDIAKLYDVSGYPTTVVIGADGRVKLYETGAISNADVAFDPILAPELVAVRQQRGITRDAYRAALASERPPEQTKSSRLEGRARSIADAMPCPCGCSDKVAACGCGTASAIKARLAQGGYDQKTDAEVMQALNREFCMKGM